MHLWDADALTIPWFRNDMGLPRQASARALGKVLDEVGVRSAIAVQAADSLAEARWLLDVVRSDPRVRRAVLQYSPQRGDLIDDAAAGVRAAVAHCATDLSDVQGLDLLAERLGDREQVLELLIRPAQLPAAGALSRRHPRTAIVVCHLGLGAGAAGGAWREALAEAASAPGLHTKVSGLDLPARGADCSRDLVRHAFDLFGTERLIFGSDWPMSVRSCSYAEVLAATGAVLPAQLDGPSFWGRTAARLYAVPYPTI